MKKAFTLITSVALATTIFAQQQPPNGGFETWPANNRNPTGWSTIESAANDAGLGFFLGNKKFTNKETAAGEFVEGAAAASVQTDSLAIPGFGTRMIPGILFLSKLRVSLTGDFGFEGAPFSSKPDVLKFSYKYKPAGVDTANFFVGLSRFNSLVDSSEFIAGGGESLFETPGSDWDTITLPIDYDPIYAGLDPDTVTIGFFSSGFAGNAGSRLWVDHVRFVYTTQVGIVEVPVETPTVMVYPNPASGIVNFKTTESIESTTATIYGLDGKVVYKRVVHNSSTDVSELANGRYFFTLHREGKAVGLGNFSVVR